ncbi:PREDICTED: glycerate kinase isoform X2 [Cercocebus atys]|uniref:Glycerate kinase n=2 Tax=Cercopithecinae TaxID=9528 RepID=A0A2K5MCC2_CERAT|nr:PREDICTED: glycerate kinase isoform X2 [Mandrillus leucophaeus]XP_011914784.1 PREDICTED: glycerate kinase isoform X2 [Cercocebus atys]
MAAALQVLPRLARAPLHPLLWRGSVARLASSMALAEQAWQLFESAVGAVLPGPMLHRALSLDPSGRQLKVRDRSFQLRQNVYLVGFGKAVMGMAAAAEELLGQHLVQGVISIPKGIRAAMERAGKQEMLLKPHSRVQVFEGAEDNLPDRDALRAALTIRQLAEGLTADDLLLVLISGGEPHPVRCGGGPCGGDCQRPHCGQFPQCARLPAYPQSLRPPCSPATFREDCAVSGRL